MAHESLKEIREELGNAVGKVARDEAGNVIGEVRAQVVRDKSGQIIGKVEDAPAVDEGPSAIEMMKDGFAQVAVEAQKTISALMDSMTNLAREARTIQDRVSQWDWQAKAKVDARVAELRAAYDQADAQVNATANEVNLHGALGLLAPFMATVDKHRAQMKRHFTEEGPGHVNRF
jgi:hypothetical protein